MEFLDKTITCKSPIKNSGEEWINIKQPKFKK